jgi:hypothetical protein
MIGLTLLTITKDMPKTLLIGAQLIQLAESEPDYSGLTAPQAATYQLLIALAALGSDQAPYRIEAATLLQVLCLRNPQALTIRLQNLSKKGRIDCATLIQKAA